MSLEDLDAVYFSDQRWRDRLEEWLRKNVPTNSFLEANAKAIEETAGRSDMLLRMVVNIPAHALAIFLRDGRYKNIYERPVVAGATGSASPRRITVDGALFPAGNAKDFYFGAVALGGSGIRYYGDYCLVLRAASVDHQTQVLDRNSYEIVDTPLSEAAAPIEVVRHLRGTWGTDLLPIVILKVLPQLGAPVHRGTAGMFSDALLHDESFVEVHKQGRFGPADIHEIRESAADPTVAATLESRRQRGQPLSPDERIWLSRRREAERQLAARGLGTRIVVTSGRTPR